MVFNNKIKILTEQEIAKININKSDLESGIYLLSYVYDNKLYLIDINKSEILSEAKNYKFNGKFWSNDVNLPPYYEGIGRGLLIGKSAGHGGRLKVANIGKDVNNDRNNKTISIYVSNEKLGSIDYTGNPEKDIKMKSAELEIYKAFVLKHNNLIQLAFNGKKP